MDALESRIERVERELRLWRGAALVALGVVVATLSIGWAGPPQRLDVNELNVVDSAGGRGRISLKVGEAGPGQPSVTLVDNQGRTRATMAVRGDGAGNRASTIEVFTDTGERIWWTPFGPSWFSDSRECGDAFPGV